MRWNKRLDLPLVIALLVVSAALFMNAWWGRWVIMAILGGGAMIIVATWWRVRGVASPLSLIPASLLLLYYTEFPGKVAAFLTVGKTLRTYDAFLYYVDRSFGFSPSVRVCAMVGRVPYLNEFFFGVYMALSLAMGACYAANLRQRRPPWRIVAVLFLTATIGVLCYNLMPACGPLMLLGTQNFLQGNEPAAVVPVILALPGDFPRNAIPSLHMTWALIVLWISRDLPRGRWLAALFVVLTAVATLSTGEHYFVDLVVAFPFALAIWTLCIGDLPLSHSRRMLTVAAAALAYLVWILILRSAPTIFYASPILPWLASAVTIGGSLYAFYSQPVFCFREEETRASQKVYSRA